MAELTLKSRIIFRKDSAAGWSTSNPILKEGEPGWDSSNKRLKIGNGINAWSDLKEAFPDPAIYTGTGITIPDNSDDTIKFGFYGNMNLFNLSTTAFYPQLANCSLGTSTQGWYTSYVEKYLSKSNTAMTFGFADGTTAFSVDRSPAAIVPSATVNNLGTSSSPWYNLYIATEINNPSGLLTIKSGSFSIQWQPSQIYISAPTVNVASTLQCLTLSSSQSTSLLPVPTGTPTIGSSSRLWSGFYGLKYYVGESSDGMIIQYNSEEEAIEFLA
jgi:hypothetical protein